MKVIEVQNSQATLIKRSVRGVGQGLLEAAVSREGLKGCSPILCTDPVFLEPSYEPFDGVAILRAWELSDSAVSGEGTEESVESSEASVSDAEPLRTFRIYAAPEDILTIGWMDSLLQALAPIGTRFAFELAGASGRVAFRFAVPVERSEILLVALQGLFPAIRVVEEERTFPMGVPSAVEELVPVPPYHRTQTLLGREGASPLGIVVAGIAGLGPDEFGLFQVLLQPADPGHDWHYNLENLVEAERRGKELALLGGLSSDFRYDRELPPLMEPSAPEKVRRDVAFYAAVVRYAAWTTSPRQASVFLEGMRSATSMVRFGNRLFRRLDNETISSAVGGEAVRRMVVDRLSHRPGLMVTSAEVATFVHLPNARTLEMFGEIEQRQGLEWTGPEIPPEEGITVGRNIYAGKERIVRVRDSARLTHEYDVGVTGTGKSNRMKTMALDDAVGGRGFIVVDPHGDLCVDLLSRLPEKRMADLEYVSFSEPGLVPRWNPFRTNVPSGKLADDIANGFAAATATFGPRMEHIIRLIAFVVHRLGGTFEDFAEICGKTVRGEELRVRGLAEIATPEVQRFLKDELPAYRASELDSVRNKLSRLLLDETLGAMFRQAKNELDPRRWMDEGRVVLVNLSSGRIGADHGRFVGGLLVSLIHRAALSRADLPEERRRPFFLYLDEFQLLQSGTLEEILSEGRKYGLGAILAHQEGGQLSGDLVKALGNCGTRVVFRPTPDDAPRLRRALLGRVTDADLLRLGVGEAFVSAGEHVASVRTDLCGYPVLRDGRQAAAEYARHHYSRIDSEPEHPEPPKRRKRKFDLFGKGLTP